MKPLATFLLLLCTTGCATIGRSASTRGSVVGVTQYVFRGVPQVAKPVIQTDVSISIERDDGSSFTTGAWTNFNTDNDSGDGVMPNGSGGDPSEIDLYGEYGFSIAEGLGARVGVVNYSFPNIGWASTTELYFALALEALGIDPSLTVFWDPDQVGGFYANAGIGRTIPIREDLGVDLGLSLGWMDESQGLAYIGREASGLTDLVGAASITYSIDEYTSVVFSLNGSTLVSGSYADVVDAAGVDDTNLWFGLGISAGL